MAWWRGGWRFIVLAFSVFLAVSGFLEQLNQAFQNAEHFMKGLGNGLKILSRGIRTAEGILDEATEEYCVYTCPDGSKPKKNRNYKPYSNGCGSQGFQVAEDQLPVKELSRCCDEHDYCYGTCNTVKEECDIKFRRCLYDICERHKSSIGSQLYKGCKASAKAMYAATLALGCKAFKESQVKACYCKGFTGKEL